MFLIKRAFVLFLVFFFIFFPDTKVLAVEVNLPNISITPNNYLLYSIKRVSEKVFLFTKISNEAKINYYKELTLKRLAELKYVVENKLIGEIQYSSQRLSYEVGTLSDFISVNKTKLTKNEAQNVKELLTSFNSLLVSLRDKYPANSSYWMLIQHDINSIDINLEKLK